METGAITKAALAGIAVAGALAVKARREGVSLSGWLVTNLLVPALYGKGDGGLDRFYSQIAENRALGPALPTRKIQARYNVADSEVAGVRCFRAERKDGRATPLTRILYLHGGAYVLDLLASQWALVTGLLDRIDAELIVPIYPLAPENDAEAGLLAVENVFHALVEEVGAANVVVIGDSAGGGLTLALAHRLRAAAAKLPAALVLFFPWLDATVDGADQPELERTDPILSIAQLRDAGRMWGGEHGPSDLRASPLFADQTGLPPTIVLVGTKDLLLSDARRFAGRRPDAVVREYSGMFHGFACAPIPEARRALDEAAHFIHEHIGSGKQPRA